MPVLFALPIFREGSCRRRFQRGHSKKKHRGVSSDAIHRNGPCRKRADFERSPSSKDPKANRHFESPLLRQAVYDLRHSLEKLAKFARVRGFPQS